MVAVVPSVVIVAELFERSRTLVVRDGKVRGQGVELRSLLDGESLARGGAPGQKGESPAPVDLSQLVAAIRPGELRAFA